MADVEKIYRITGAGDSSSINPVRRYTASERKAKMEMMEEEIGTSPILLLDDVMSELDQERQLHMIEYIERCQTLITCTGVEDSIRRLPVGERFRVEKGKVYKENNSFM